MIKIEGNAYKFDAGTLLSTAVRLDGSADPNWYEVSEEDEQTAKARVLLKAQLAIFAATLSTETCSAGMGAPTARP